MKRKISLTWRPFFARNATGHPPINPVAKNSPMTPSGPESCFKLGFEHLDFLRAKLVHWEHELTGGDVFPLDVEVK
jgi:hypothetical protein